MVGCVGVGTSEGVCICEGVSVCAGVGCFHTVRLLIELRKVQMIDLILFSTSSAVGQKEVEQDVVEKVEELGGKKYNSGPFQSISLPLPLALPPLTLPLPLPLPPLTLPLPLPLPPLTL